MKIGKVNVNAPSAPGDRLSDALMQCHLWLADPVLPAVRLVRERLLVSIARAEAAERQLAAAEVLVSKVDALLGWYAVSQRPETAPTPTVRLQHLRDALAHFRRSTTGGAR